METEHTPGKLKARNPTTAYIGSHQHAIIEIVCDKEDQGVAVCILPRENYTKKSYALIKANAKHLVTCWNSHDELLAACKATINIIGIKDITKAKDLAKAAIYLAEKEG